MKLLKISETALVLIILSFVVSVPVSYAVTTTPPSYAYNNHLIYYPSFQATQYTYYADNRVKTIMHYDLATHKLDYTQYFYDDAANRQMAYLSSTGQYTHNSNDAQNTMDIYFDPKSSVNGATAFKFEGYENSRQLKTKWCYKTANVSDPANPVLIGLVAMETYKLNGELESRTTYYNSGRINTVTDYENGNPRATTYYYDDANNRQKAMVWANGEYRHFMNEGPGNIGRMDVFFNPTDPINGITAYKYEYFGNTNQIKTIYGYETADVKNVSLPTLKVLKCVYTYNQSGVLIYHSGVDIDCLASSAQSNLLSADAQEALQRMQLQSTIVKNSNDSTIAPGVKIVSQMASSPAKEALPQPKK